MSLKSPKLQAIEKILQSHPFITTKVLQHHLIQSAGSVILPYYKNKDWKTERRYIGLADGTKLGVDCLFQQEYEKHATVVVLDGFLGSSKSNFSLGMGQKAYHFGFNVILLNQRGQGDTTHLTQSLNDSGLEGDLGYALSEFVKWGCKKIYIVGLSWGAFLALREIGLQGEKAKEYIKGLTMISNPIDLVRYSHYSEKKEYNFFNWFFMKEMDKLAKRRLKLDPPGTWDTALKKKKRSVRQWDEAFMHAWGNFASIDEYYALVSALALIPCVQIPTLAIHSYDDQIMPADQFEAVEFKNTEHIITLLTTYGAHGGFIAAKKRYGDLDRHWAQKRKRIANTAALNSRQEAVDELNEIIKKEKKQ